jgi:hypothetical protein
MDFFVPLIGFGLIAFALLDIYLTVLFPRLSSSLLSLWLAKKLWYLFRSTAHLPFLKRDRWLAHSGSIAIITIVTVWITLLITGFACISWVELGSGIQASQGQTPTDFGAALYYSGYAFTTLGTGDLVPRTALARLLMVAQAGLGFSTFTLTLTYLFSIYNAINQRNTFALSLHHQSNSTADAAELLIRLMPDGDSSTVQRDVSSIARDLMFLLEAQHSYPVLLYFRFRQIYYALPRIVFLSMHVATLIKSGLHPEVYRPIVRSAAIAELWGGGLQLLLELSHSFHFGDRSHPDQGQEEIWRNQYYQAIERFNREGIKTTPDLEAGADLYVHLRRKWNAHLFNLTDHMAYQWHDIAPNQP